MKTLNVSISELEFSKFGLKQEQYTFSDFLEIVGRELTKKNLADSVTLAEKYGLSKMAMAEISKEVKAVRKNAKGHS
jgi:hypothetical protein